MSDDNPNTSYNINVSIGIKLILYVSIISEDIPKISSFLIIMVDDLSSR